MTEKQWKIYHKFEDELDRRFLRKLSARKSFEILKQLYHFAYQGRKIPRYMMIDMEKIRVLSHIHSLFGKVESL